MFNISGIKGCYAYKGHLVLLSNGELGTYVHRRRCKNLNQKNEKTPLEHSSLNSVQTEEDYLSQG